MKNKLLLLTAILFIGCGTTKKTSEETEIKKDSLIKKETTISETESNKKETTLNYKASTFTFEPIDPKIPYFVKGEKYENVKVVNKTESEDKKIIEEQNKQINTLINEITQLKELFKQEKQSKEVDYSETIKIIANRFIWLIAIIVIIFIALNWIKNKTTLL